MNVVVKIGRKDGMMSSLNLFFENGLRLKTDDLCFMASADKAALQTQFDDVVAALILGGFTVTNVTKETQ